MADKKEKMEKKYRRFIGDRHFFFYNTAAHNRTGNTDFWQSKPCGR